MNRVQKRLLLKRVEKFGDAIAGGMAATGATVLFKDGSVVVGNVTLAAVMFTVAVSLYFAFSWLLNELGAFMDSEMEEEVFDEEEQA